MLLLNIGIIAGVYIGKRVLDTRRKIRKVSPIHIPEKSEQTPIAAIKLTNPKPAEDSLSHAKISITSVLMVSAGYFFYPPLTLISIGIISYNLAPVLQRSFKTLRTDNKINNDSYGALVTVLLVGTGNVFAAALHNVVYHTSNHLIDKRRADSAQLAVNAYQQVPETVWIRIGMTGQSDYWWSNTARCWLRRSTLEQQIPLEQVKVGDGIIVNTGTTIPVAGLIIEGSALIDQQVLTGEASPQEKVVGDRVIGATIVLSGRIVIEAAHNGAETRISKLNGLL